MSSWTPHFGEEPVLTGAGGVGNVFFGHCNLRCVYCQNWQISQQGKSTPRGQTLTPHELAAVYLELQERGCGVLGWVSPSHVIPQAVEALALAAESGLRIPVVYNTNAYDAVPALRLLDGVVDLWLPDLKYGRDEEGYELSGVPEYARIAREAIEEMWRQVGSEVHLGPDGVAFKGLIIRHLILPNELAGSASSLGWVKATLGTEVHLSLMAQYFPTHRTEGRESRFPLLTRSARASEYQEVLQLMDELGFENGWAQDLESAPEYYLPDFEDSAVPFKDVADFQGAPQISNHTERMNPE
ncbi:MAG: radical SAM protein, partial [Myxococcota bacterium]|nr:radical SAM protein [Myxococcota bacterium]